MLHIISMQFEAKERHAENAVLSTVLHVFQKVINLNKEHKQSRGVTRAAPKHHQGPKSVSMNSESPKAAQVS